MATTKERIIKSIEYELSHNKDEKDILLLLINNEAQFILDILNKPEIDWNKIKKEVEKEAEIQAERRDSDRKTFIDAENYDGFIAGIEWLKNKLKV